MPMPATHHLLHPGYVRDEGVSVGSSVSLVTDGEAVIVVDPGMVASRAAILEPLAALAPSARRLENQPTRQGVFDRISD